MLYPVNTFYACCLGSLLVLAACQPMQSHQEQAATSTTDADLPPPTQVTVAYAVPDAFSTRVNTILTSYLATKDALVASDAQQANQKAGDLIVAVQQADTASLQAPALQKWTEHRKILERAATTLQAATKMNEKRASFEDLSQAMYTFVNDFGANVTLYKEYCPMAFNDKGAFWLSAQSQIRNPYFGDKMLECGEVQEVLQFKE